MKCVICGKNFEEGEMKGIQYTQTMRDGKTETGFIKKFEYNDKVIEPCQDCLLPFAKGFIFGRNTANGYSEKIEFEDVEEI